MRYDSETLRRLQLLELEMLEDIDGICKQLDIPYFLDSGTALGAIRHGGFIPWDDDVDLGMLREGYERFLQDAPALLEEKGCILVSPRTDDVVAGQFAKVMKMGTTFRTRETEDAGFRQGVFVDIFPYDQLSADPATAREQIKKCRFWQRVSYLYHSPHVLIPHGGILGACERAACWLFHGAARILFTPQRIAHAFDGWALKGAADASSRAIACAYPVKDGFEVDWLFPAQDMRFEGKSFPVPKDMDAYLTHLYGDWRELPPEDQRVNHAPLMLDLGTAASGEL